MADKQSTTEHRNREIELISIDEIRVKVNADLLEKFPWFSGMMNFQPNQTVFELEHVNGQTLLKIVEWMEYEGSGRMPMLTDPETRESRVLSDWEDNFARSITDEELVELMIDTDYFDMKNLLEVLTSVASFRISTYSIEKIRTMFHIAESGYTPQEEQKLDSEIQWALRFQD